MNKRARKHHMGFFPFLRLIIDAQGKTETVVQQMNAGYWLVRSSAAYGVQQRRVAALTCRLHAQAKNILFLEEDIGTYGFIFQALINKAAVLRVNLNPQTIICDFETALISAIQGYFPNILVQSCYFHFCQAVHRKVGEMGLKTNKKKNQNAPGHRFPPCTASSYTGVSLLEAGTTRPITNYLEGWHNQLNKKAAKDHSGLYELLQLLIAEQDVFCRFYFVNIIH
ncbi:hypothetical protein T11_3383 [Trichinella zimbabwensis]|uniref:MULE transposase domain-containing protein n=1 Tax=Trichinella zimbabwensis TaxID=268475 RepID=A0A0V1HJ31_9BILA|nr:hypothetical protein T11_3383 [Trichinella zimbabwensis]